MTETDSQLPESERFPTIPVSDRQARILSKILTFIFTVYFTVLLWVFVLLPISKLLTRFLE